MAELLSKGKNREKQQMIKKIKTGEIKIGMFIHDFNCSWLDHPFFTSSLKITSDDMIKKVIKAGIRLCSDRADGCNLNTL